MKSDMDLNTSFTQKYDQYARQVFVMGNTTAILAFASIYTQEGYPDFHIETVFITAFIVTVFYLLFRTIHDNGFYRHFISRFREYGKMPIARIISLTWIGILALRFLLPNETVYYIQVALYAAAGIFLIAGIIFLIPRH